MVVFARGHIGAAVQARKEGLRVAEPLSVCSLSGLFLNGRPR
jgi:hypothetical protein